MYYDDDNDDDDDDDDDDNDDVSGIDDVDDDDENDENDDDGDFYLQKHRCRNIDRFRPYWLDVFSVYSVYRK